MQESKGTIPVPLLYVTAVLLDAGYAPDILDLSVASMEEGQSLEGSLLSKIEQHIRKLDPALIEFNCFVSQHLQFIVKAAKYIRNIAPAIHIAVGGAHPTLFAEEILRNCPDIDSVILGEGEEQIVALARAVESRKIVNLRSVQAIACRSNKKIIINARRNYIADSDALHQAAV